MNNSIGENIKIMRHKCGFTQDELASMLNVTPQAVSKWENGNGTPDISQLVPLSQIFGITTDSLLGVVSAVFGNAHTEAALGHEKLLMSTSQPEAEKHLAAYTYFRAESEKEPTNYIIMRKCINHGASISRFTDFDGFLSDKPELRDEIFADCERKNLCISRYCEDRSNVEKSDYAMIWIYIHNKEFDKARKLIERLPSLASNNLQEHIMPKLVLFQFGFDKEKDMISKNLVKLFNASGKEFFYSLESYMWFGEAKEAVKFGEKILGILEAYNAFDCLKSEFSEFIMGENQIRKLMTRGYARLNEFEKSAEQLLIIAENCAAQKNPDKTEALSEIEEAINNAEDDKREMIRFCEAYSKAMNIINSID